MKWEQPIDYFEFFILDKRLVKKIKKLNNNQKSDGIDEFEEWDENVMFCEHFHCQSFPEFRKQLIKKYPFLKRAKFSKKNTLFVYQSISFWHNWVGSVYIHRKNLGFKDLFDFYAERGKVQYGLDKLPQHGDDGYWSGGYKAVENDKSKYAEGTKNVGDLAVANNKREYPYSLELNGVDFNFADQEDWRCYVENVALSNLINDVGDNFIRWIPLNSISSYKNAGKLKGMFCVRCGDCGKVAQGLFNGNPDMGDPAYKVYHRKNWFCDNFGWTYMGGHGYPGGRRMICPDCSQEYASGKRKLNGGKEKKGWVVDGEVGDANASRMYIGDGK